MAGVSVTHGHRLACAQASHRAEVTRPLPTEMQMTNARLDAVAAVTATTIAIVRVRHWLDCLQKSHPVSLSQTVVVVPLPSAEPLILMPSLS